MKGVACGIVPRVEWLGDRCVGCGENVEKMALASITNEGRLRLDRRDVQAGAQGQDPNCAGGRQATRGRAMAGADGAAAGAVSLGRD